MRPDVARLGVYAKDGLEAGLDGWQWRSVTLEQEVVVPQPIGQSVMRHRFPAALPHILGKLFHLFGAVLGHE